MQSVYTILLLIVSNIFMTCAWYGHLKMKQQFSWFEHLPLFGVILFSWFLAFFEYCFQVPANRIGFRDNGGPFNLIQLKVIQEVITLVVFVASVPSLLRGSRLNGTMRLLSYSWSRRFIWFSRNKVVAFGFDNQRKTLMPIVRYLQCLFKHVYNAHCKHLIMGIVKTLYDLLAQMCKYSFGLIRMEPCYFWVPFKPSHLLPGVDPGVSFDFLHGEV